MHRRTALLLAMGPLGSLGSLGAAAQAQPHQAELLRRLMRFNRGFGGAELDAVLDEWQRLLDAGQAGERERNWVLAALMDAGRFDDARQLAAGLAAGAQQRWPRVEPIAAGARHCWRLDGERLREIDVAAHRGPQLWVQSAHGCGFCRLAAAQLGDDAELAPLLSRHSLWLAPGSDLFRVDDWDRRYPSFPLHLLTDRRGWALPAGWATPTFVFTRDGEPLQQFAGWPKDGSFRQRLVQGLSAIGLI